MKFKSDLVIPSLLICVGVILVGTILISNGLTLSPIGYLVLFLFGSPILLGLWQVEKLAVEEGHLIKTNGTFAQNKRYSRHLPRKLRGMCPELSPPLNGSLGVAAKAPGV